MTGQNKAYIYGLAAVALWATCASAFKVSLRYMDPVQLLLYSSAVSTLVLGVIAARRGELARIGALTGGQWLRALGLGLLNPTIYYLMIFKSYDLLPAQAAQPLNQTWAITMALLSAPLLKHKLTRDDLVATVIAYFGAAVVSTQGDLLGLSFPSGLGVFLALASTVVWSLYWIYNTKSDLSPVLGLLLTFILAWPIILVYCLIFSDPIVVDWRAWAGATYVGLFEYGLTYVLWLTAMKLTDSASRIGNLIFLCPVLSLGIIHTVVGEEIRSSTLVGLAFILVGLSLQKIRPLAKLKKPGRLVG